MRTLPPILSALFLATANAEDFYVAQSAAGGDTGADCSNAKSLSWLNNPSNWGTGAGKVSAGDTVHLCGTFTGQLAVAGSGSAGSPVILRFESGAKFTANWWPYQDGAIKVNGKQWITLDGGSNGLIESTNNGTALGVQTNATGVYLLYTTNVTVQNLTVTNLYVRTPESSDSQGGQQGVFAVGPAVNLTVQNCDVSHAEAGIYCAVTYGENIVIRSNRIRDVSWGIACATSSGSGAVYGSHIYQNTITDLWRWASGYWLVDPGPPERYEDFHADGIFVWASFGGGVHTNCNIYQNHIGGIVGEGCTAGIYVSGNSNSMWATVYNNVVWTAAGASNKFCNGSIFVRYAPGTKIFNNTLIGNGEHAGMWLAYSNQFPTVISNNVLKGHTLIYQMESSVNMQSDRNLYYGYTETSPFFINAYPLVGTNTWIATLGHDVNSVWTDPLLDSNYKLTAGSPAIGVGANLNSYFTTDFDGTTRGTTWDIGAYEYEPPPPPTGLVIENLHVENLVIRETP